MPDEVTHTALMVKLENHDTRLKTVEAGIVELKDAVAKNTEAMNESAKETRAHMDAAHEKITKGINKINFDIGKAQGAWKVLLYVAGAIAAGLGAIFTAFINKWWNGQ